MSSFSPFTESNGDLWLRRLLRRSLHLLGLNKIQNQKQQQKHLKRVVCYFAQLGHFFARTFVAALFRRLFRWLCCCLLHCCCCCCGCCCCYLCWQRDAVGRRQRARGSERRQSRREHSTRSSNRILATKVNTSHLLLLVFFSLCLCLLECVCCLALLLARLCERGRQIARPHHAHRHLHVVLALFERHNADSPLGRHVLQINLTVRHLVVVVNKQFLFCCLFVCFVCTFAPSVCCLGGSTTSPSHQARARGRCSSRVGLLRGTAWRTKGANSSLGMILRSCDSTQPVQRSREEALPAHASTRTNTLN
jgi:hypothetical protein